MSTIEKAIDKLGKRSGSSSSGKEGPEGTRVEAVEQSVPAAPPEVAGLAEGGTPTDLDSHTPSGLGADRQDRGAGRIVELPLAMMADMGMVTPIAPRSRVAEEFRTIKRPLLRNIDGRNGVQVDNANLIMVTSPLQGDGKTFTALSLAISIAMEQDKTVLFVDADVSKASAGTLLGVPEDSPGLIDVLEQNGVALADVILPTSIDNLKVLPAGNLHERSTELLASKNMLSLMLEMSTRYADRVIVFDSPPLLLTTEASVLASFMGQIAFVVSTDETPEEAVSKSLEHIGQDKMVGTILNKAHSRRNKLYGRYDYRYGYGYGSGRAAKDQPVS